MNTELEKLEAKRTEMQDELDTLKPLQVRNPDVIKRVIWLSTALCDCDKMLADARTTDVNKKRATEPFHQTQ